jgi:hypothetical protein
LSELLLVDNTVLVLVYIPENVDKVLEEFFVGFELKIQDDLQIRAASDIPYLEELLELDSLFILIFDKILPLFSGHSTTILIRAASNAYS